MVLIGMDILRQITLQTAWLREGQDLTAARIAYVLRERGIDVKSLICAKIFPDIKDPTSGALITPQGEVFQFAFNREGRIIEAAQIDEWVNITRTYLQHPWRDDILAGLAFISNSGQQ